MYGLSVIAGPDEEPVTLEQAKAHLRVQHAEEDALIQDWIKAAREYSEGHADRRWVSREYRLTLAGWPCGSVAGLAGAIEIPVSPVLSVEAVKYYSTAGVLTTLAAGEWQTWLDHGPPLVAPAPAKAWPTVETGRAAAVRVEFTAGYAGAADVPERAKAAIRLCLGYWYEHRGDSDDPFRVPATLGLPPGAKRLLDSLASGAY